MSTYTSEPGTRLAGRYRLVDQTSVGTGWAFWKATDETLARSVTVLTFAAGFPRIIEAVRAARAASRLGDPRFSQVFDVEDAGEQAYVVLEWVGGESLVDMLADGPLDAPVAVSLLCEAAQALATAHAGGLAHLRLNPACLHWTRGSGVKITGLGIDAVLDGVTPASDGADDGPDAELTDTRDLARLLYAALTGYWPAWPDPAGPGTAEPAGLEGAGPEGAAGPQDAAFQGGAGLPAAPEADGMPRTPRQVSAAVPATIDALTCQALFQRPSRHGPALTTPATALRIASTVGNPVARSAFAVTRYTFGAPRAWSSRTLAGKPTEPRCSWTVPRGGPSTPLPRCRSARCPISPLPMSCAQTGLPAADTLTSGISGTAAITPWTRGAQVTF